jgi:hypothetical protein
MTSDDLLLPNTGTTPTVRTPNVGQKTRAACSSWTRPDRGAQSRLLLLHVKHPCGVWAVRMLRCIVAARRGGLCCIRPGEQQRKQPESGFRSGSRHWPQEGNPGPSTRSRPR